ncbi:TetR/AcrR family transcriptional regulator [Pseudomonas akapageensis]|uniref:TetR/AcrR family transcriptional regulator n=1 Tax=Pseudomonas akapageensis TaxID=2609961 RepID=UPI00140AEAB7|nr:TetR/AcrR family transcriptional regulator [Pseudomonas akapageensis]
MTTDINLSSTVSTASAPPSAALTDPRERLLAATEQLIYQGGICATGMDLIVQTSGVARKTLYRYFRTKDDLVAEALRQRDQRWMHWFIESVGNAGTPRERLLKLFQVLQGWFDSAGFRGCAFINAAGEIGDPHDPVRVVAKLHKEKLLAYVRELCEAYGAEQPENLAQQLMILIEGAITVALVSGDTDSATRAQVLARLLLDQQRPHEA